MMYLNLVDCSDGLMVIQQRIQNKKLNKLMVDFIDEVHVDD